MKTAEQIIKEIQDRTYETNEKFTINIAYSDLQILIDRIKQIDRPLPDEKENPYWYWPQCDVSGCKGVSSSGGVHWKETGYWSICPKHADMCRAGEPQPKMRKSAIDENASRDPQTGYLPSKSIN